MTGKAAVDQQEPSPAGVLSPRPATLHSRIGRSVIHDPVSGMTMTLPSDVLIHQGNGQIWLGSAADSRIFVYLTRIRQSSDELPTILAEGDLDMYLCSVGPSELQDGNRMMLSMAGTLGRRSIRGCLARSRPVGGYAYLVLTACLDTDETAELFETNRQLLRAIDSAA